MYSIHFVKKKYSYRYVSLKAQQYGNGSLLMHHRCIPNSNLWNQIIIFHSIDFLWKICNLNCFRGIEIMLNNIQIPVRSSDRPAVLTLNSILKKNLLLPVTLERRWRFLLWQFSVFVDMKSLCTAFKSASSSDFNVHIIIIQIIVFFGLKTVWISEAFIWYSNEIFLIHSCSLNKTHRKTNQVSLRSNISYHDGVCIASTILCSASPRTINTSHSVRLRG